MDVRIHMRQGVAHDLCLVIPNEELEECLLSVPGWDKLAQSYGYLRHRAEGMPRDLKLPASYDPESSEERECKRWQERDAGIKRYKVTLEEHLKRLEVRIKDKGEEREPLLDSYGRSTRRAILIGNRNLGNNPGFVAWHQDKSPQCFHLKSEPVTERPYSCLVCHEDGHLGIESVEFKPKGSDYHPHCASDGEDLAGKIEWCSFGQQVLRAGKLVDIEEIIDQFYDIRHVLWFPTHRVGKSPCPAAEAELRALYEGYPDQFKERACHELRAGRPRSRYFHNAVGIGPDKIVILQRHGTVEEIGQWLREEGVEDGLILDNGGSVFTWTWWPIKEIKQVQEQGETKSIRVTGGLIFNSPDWRPPSISTIAFVLKGPPRHEEPGGSVAFTVG